MNLKKGVGIDRDTKKWGNKIKIMYLPAVANLSNSYGTAHV